MNGTVGGSADIGTISGGLYTAPAVAPSSPIQVTTMDAISGATSFPASVTIFTSNSINGKVATSNNPLVASYTVDAPDGAAVQVQFGTTTGYGLNTWIQKAPPGGGTTSVLVAGMRAGTTYHMMATMSFPDGKQVSDTDRTFTTGSVPASVMPSITIPQAAGSGTAPGVELLDIFDANTTKLTALATDLAGNLIWYYPFDLGVVNYTLKLLPNGNMLTVLNGGVAEVREIDLAGNVVYRITKDQVDASLTAVGAGFQVANFHHDAQKLPNGHYILLVNFIKTFSDVPGFSDVTGDALIDWDPVANAVAWSWSSFDHIPLTHAPVSNSDWTHANAVVYSPDDGALIMSMRNQNWVLKINYKDGAGDGAILWHMGPGGDFTLPAGQDPIEWNYGQHYPTIQSPNSAGIIDVMVFNNGNNRLVDASGDLCGATGQIACYSSVPTYQLNETTHTAQVLSEVNLGPAFSACCGDAEVLPNGDLEYDIAFDVATPGQSRVQEVTPGTTPNLQWQLDYEGTGVLYRGFRIPSLYPGVTWTLSDVAAANTPAAKKGAGSKTP